MCTTLLGTAAVDRRWCPIFPRELFQAFRRQEKRQQPHTLQVCAYYTLSTLFDPAVICDSENLACYAFLHWHICQVASVVLQKQLEQNKTVFSETLQSVQTYACQCKCLMCLRFL